MLLKAAILVFPSPLKISPAAFSDEGFSVFGGEVGRRSGGLLRSYDRNSCPFHFHGRRGWVKQLVRQ